MAMNHKIVIRVSKNQKELIKQNSEIFGYENVGEYVRDSVLTKNFLIIDRLTKISKFMEVLQDGNKKATS